MVLEQLLNDPEFGAGVLVYDETVVVVDTYVADQATTGDWANSWLEISISTVIKTLWTKVRFKGLDRNVKLTCTVDFRKLYSAKKTRILL